MGNEKGIQTGNGGEGAETVAVITYKNTLGGVREMGTHSVSSSPRERLGFFVCVFVCSLFI